MSRRARQVVMAAVAAALVVLGAAGAALFAQRADRAAMPTDLEQLGRYGRVPFFTLTERSGRPVTLDDLRGSVWVADFIYTECTESCPTQSLALARLQREFAEASGLRLVSITVDPQHDTPAVLRQYAERYGATDRWWFLTGDKRAIYCLARDGFRLSVSDPADPDVRCGALSWLQPAPAWAHHGSHGLVLHSARVALVDRAGEIRAYHLATDPESTARLRENIRTLLDAR